MEPHHGGHECRCGAYVGGCALALDVLLAHLQRHAQRTVSETVHRYADDASRKVALECLACGHVAGRRASEAHRASEPLRSADGDVGAPLGRRREQYEREQVGGDCNERSGRMRRGREVGVVAYLAVGCRVLYQRAELLARKFVSGKVVHDKFDAERLAAGEQYVERLREYLFVDEYLVASLPDSLARAEGEHHQHRLGRRGALVEQRAVGYLHSGERTYGRLEVEQRLEASLRNLGLIRRVGGVPCRILEYVAHDGRRYGVRVVTHSDKRAQLAVLVGQGAYVCGKFVFAHAVPDAERPVETYGLGYHLRNELLDGGDSYGFEHGFQLVGICRPDVTVCEFVEHDDYCFMAVNLWINMSKRVPATSRFPCRRGLRRFVSAKITKFPSLRR